MDRKVPCAAFPASAVPEELASLPRLDRTSMSEIGERSAMNDDFRYSIDLSVARARAEKIIECIKRLRENHDIRRFEYTKHLRVAPTETPHSHPILTLNTQLHNPDEILCEYLHEQMHWYGDR